MSKIKFNEGITFGDHPSFGKECLEAMDNFVSWGSKKVLLLNDLDKQKTNSGIEINRVHKTFKDYAIKIALCLTVIIPIICLVGKAIFRATYNFEVSQIDNLEQSTIEKTKNIAGKVIDKQTISKLDNRLHTIEDQRLTKQIEHEMGTDLIPTDQTSLIQEEVAEVLPHLISRTTYGSKKKPIPQHIKDKLDFDAPNYDSHHEVFSLKRFPGLVFKWMGTSGANQARYRKAIFAKKLTHLHKLEELYVPKTALMNMTIAGQQHTLLVEERLKLPDDKHQEHLYFFRAPKLEKGLADLTRFLYHTQFGDITRRNINFPLMTLADGTHKIVVIDPETIHNEDLSRKADNKPKTLQSTCKGAYELIRHILPIDQGKLVGEVLAKEAGHAISDIEEVYQVRPRTIEELRYFYQMVKEWHVEHDITSVYQGLETPYQLQKEDIEYLKKWYPDTFSPDGTDDIIKERFETFFNRFCQVAKEEIDQTPEDFPLEVRRYLKLNIPIDEPLTVKEAGAFMALLINNRFISCRNAHKEKDRLYMEFYF